MSYQVLARQYRPQSFQELVGQEHVAQALINALDQDRLHHAYLFTGTRGVGKTTIARILSKCLNCETGVSSQPCGTCTSCQEISEGRFVDLIEVDAASRTKVEDTRELLDNVQYAPTRGRYKVYLIDEVHMLSAHSFNALLKTLEEPPPHVKFLLATTDPQKLPVTILSRCLQFSLKAMTPQKIVEHLTQILEKESISCEEPALWQLARSANGSMRDALSLTDQAISYGAGKITETEVSTMLGTIDRGLVYRVMEALRDGDAAACMQVVQDISEMAPDWHTVLLDLSMLLHRIAMAQAVPGSIDNSLGDRDVIMDFAAAMPAEDVQLYYQIAITSRRDLSLAPDARSGFEMALLRMTTFLPGSGGKNTTNGEVKKKPESRVAPRQAEPAAAKAVAEEAVTGTTEATKTGTAAEPPVGAEAPAGEPVNSVPEPAPQPASNVVPLKDSRKESHQEPERQAERQPEKKTRQEASGRVDEQTSPRPKEASVAGGDGQSLLMPSMKDPWKDEWADLVARSGLQGGALNLARHCKIREREGNVWKLSVSSDVLASDDMLQKMTQAIGRVTGSDIRIVVEEAPAKGMTPAELMEKRQQERVRVAENLLKSDAVVRQLTEEFGAWLDSGSVRPFDNEEHEQTEG